MQDAQQLLESGRKALEKNEFTYAIECFTHLQEVGAQQNSAIIALLANDGLGRTYAAMQDNMEAKKSDKSIPRSGFAVLQQQYMLVQSMEEWIASVRIPAVD